MALSNNKILFVFIIICFINSSKIHSQEAPGFAWKSVFGTKKTEKGIDLIPTLDGKIAILGETNGIPNKNKDATLLLLNENGEKQWQKNYGGEKEDRLNSIHQTYDGGYLLAGYTTSKGMGKKDAWLLKTNELGDTLWQKTMGSPNNDAFADVIQTTDGGIAAVGFIHPSSESKKTWVYRAYDDGELRWQKTFGNDGKSEARAIVETQDGNFAIAGTTTSGKGNRNIWLFVLDKEGRPLHHQIYGSRQFEEVSSLIALADGGFALAGVAKSNKRNNGKGLKDMWLIKTAADGELIWERTFGGSNNDSAFGVTETTDGGLVLVGYTFSHIMGANTSKAMVVKCKFDGEIEWEMDAIGGKNNDEMNAVTLMPDGTFAMVGTTSSKSENAQKHDLWAMKFRPDFTVNTLIPTNLEVTNVKLRDNGDNFLEEGEKAYFDIEIENTGNQDAVDVIFIINEKTKVKGLEYRQAMKIGFIKAGQTKRFFVPISVNNEVEFGDAEFQFYSTDASRSRSEFFEISYPTKKLTVPSNFLATAWMDPSPIDFDNLYKIVKTNRIPIKIKARSDKPLKRRHFTILINGEPYKVGQKAGEAGLYQKKKTNSVFDFEYQNFVDLNVGLNLVQVVVNNESKIDSSAVFQIEYSDKPNLHILAIGIEHDDLNYTTKDAKDFANSFQNQEGKLFDKIHLTTLTSGTKTRAGKFQTNGQVIKNAFANLQESYNYTVYDRDLLLIFMSSHGKTINNRFKIVPSDFGMEGEASLIDYSNDILKPLEKIYCHKLLLIDACHSGSYESEVVGVGIEGDGRADALLELSETLQSTNTMASCLANESSWEDKNWENGAFTEALIGAFNNENYKDANGAFKVSEDNEIITVEELYRYLQRRVPQMILDVGKQGSQHPFLSEQQLGRVKDLPVFEVN